MKQRYAFGLSDGGRCNFYGYSLGLMTCFWVATPVIAEDVTDTPTEAPPAPQLERILVVGQPMSTPGEVSADTRQVRQPLPAHDGADYLKGFTGFSMIRKGGASGDPVFRGMAASRVNILTDGEMLLGGCSSRMDPPTAYISPQAYDRIVVVKGPHNVTDGPGSSAATVRFERDEQRLTESTQAGYYNLTGASFGRVDGQLEALVGQREGFFRLNAGYARADDYADGQGQSVHSAYERWNTQLTAGWTPTDTRLLSLSLGTSDGEAAYADRGMDGTRFRRENLGLRWREQDISPLWQKLELQAYYNYVDHVMDNYSLREFSPTPMMNNPAASNPDRRTRGLKFQAQADLAPDWELKVGFDGQDNRHRDRRSMNQAHMPYQDMSRDPDADVRQFGLYGELTWSARSDRRWQLGLRADSWRARDLREKLGNMAASEPNPTAGERRSENLLSGFIRYEQDTGLGTWYFGPGYVERFPDYWELVGNNRSSENSPTAFRTSPERTLQWDAGWLWHTSNWQHSVNVFYGDIADYILIDGAWEQNGETVVAVRNIDAETMGFEWDGQYQWSPTWETEFSLAYTRGRNSTDQQPLAQQPPLEFLLSQQLNLGQARYGLAWRLVQGQHRVSPEQGNIAGLDLGTTGGFGTLAAHGRWQFSSELALSVGVDNLLDRQYTEHLSKSGAMVTGYLPQERLPEPGRTWWANLSYRF